MAYLYSSFNSKPSSLKTLAKERWLRYLLRKVPDLSVIFRSESEPDLNNHLKSPSIKSIKQDQYLGEIRQYMNSLLPPNLQEHLFHSLIDLCKKELVEPMQPRGLSVLLRIFWQTQFKVLELPLLKESRIQLLQVVGDKFDENSNAITDNLEIVSIKVFNNAEINLHEYYIIKRLLQKMNNLKVLVLKQVCSNDMLSTINRTCPKLERLDVSHSVNVSDEGISSLLDIEQDKFCKNYCKKCENKIKYLNIERTSCTHKSVVMAILNCQFLENIKFDEHLGQVVVESLNDLIIDFETNNEKRPDFGLKRFMAALKRSEEKFELKTVLSAMPNLEELSIDMCNARLRSFQGSKLEYLCHLRLSFLNSPALLSDLLSSWGQKLSKLSLNQINFELNLDIIGNNCPNLKELHVFKASLTLSPNHICDVSTKNEFLARLKHADFSNVHFVPLNISENSIFEPKTALHCLLNHAKYLETLRASAPLSLIDDDLVQLLHHCNRLKRLQTLILSFAVSKNDIFNNKVVNVSDFPIHEPLKLTINALLALVEHCNELRVVGDLRCWSVEPKDMLERLALVHGEKRKWIKSDRFVKAFVQ